MNHDGSDRPDDVRYVLTEQGMRFLAARAGVPPSTFGEHGAVTYVKEADQGHPERAVRHVEHTLGLNRFMVQLARDARARGWRLAAWHNEAESTCRFSEGAGPSAWIRPDASGVIDTREERVPFLVEYDRGTLDAGNYRGKFEGYRRYYKSEAWRTRFDQEPVLLFPCADDRAERRLVDALSTAAVHAPIVVAAEWRYRVEGTFGAIWQTQQDGSTRITPLPIRGESDPGASTAATREEGA